MNRQLHRLWQRALRRFGTTGVLALATVLPAVALLVWLQRLEAQGDALEAAVESQARVARAPARALQRPPSADEQSTAFLDGLPTWNQSSKDLDTVFKLARRSRISLAKGEYQLKPDSNTALVAYSAVFPVRDDYRQIKRFTVEVLKALPHASLDELRMSRPDASSPELDATVRFTLVYRSL
jgi:hypothetical protein